MLSRRTMLYLAALPLFSGPLMASEVMLFTQAAFDAAQAAGKPIFVEISASWCPTCKAQKPIIGELSSRGAFKDVVILDVDFDSQKDVVRSFGATMQSTLIAFKGKTEVDRTVGVTDPAVIEAMFAKAVSG